MNYLMSLISVVPSIHKWFYCVQNLLTQISTWFLKTVQRVRTVLHTGSEGVEPQRGNMAFSSPSSHHRAMSRQPQSSFGNFESPLKGASSPWWGSSGRNIPCTTAMQTSMWTRGQENRSIYSKKEPLRCQR